MSNNRFRGFTALYRQNLQEVRFEILAVIIAALLLDGWFYFHLSYASGAILIPIFLTTGLAFFVPLLSSFKLLGRELGSNQSYLIMSLPVSGASVMAAKMLALITQLILGVLACALIGGLMLPRRIPISEISSNMPLLIQLTTYALVGSLVFAILILSVSLFSQTVGLLIRRRRWLLTLAVFILIVYLGGRISGVFLEQLLGWARFSLTPDFEAKKNALSLVFNCSVIFDLVLAFVLTGLSALIYDRKVEI